MYTQLEEVTTMSDLNHAVYQLFPDAVIDVDNDSGGTVVIYTHLRYDKFDGTVSPIVR